jgi:uncharacterized protein (TIGR04141 family)
MSVQPKTNKLIIYMIKPEYQDFGEILGSSQEGQVIEGVGTFYSEESRVHTPDWVQDFFGSTLSDNLGIRAASARGALFLVIEHESEKIIFIVSFGFGRFLLKKGVFEERFGLKVVLNVVDPKSLRSIDKTTLGSIPKQSREQISRDGIAADFGIDIEQDLINSVTGKSKDPRFGKIVTGRDALSVSVKVDVHSIKDFLKLCLERYKSEDYKEDFGWIDQITDIRALKQIDELNGQLLNKLNAGDFDKIWMAVPVVVDWVDISGFRYLRQTGVDLHDDLDIQDFITASGRKTFDINFLRDTLVYVISSKKDEVIDSWSTFDCFYAEMELNDKVYILNNGKWYEIVKDFTKQVKDEFNSIKESNISFPDYDHDDEKQYNEAVAIQIPNVCCMDRKEIMHGGGHSKIEFCDLLTKEKSIIHVKRYGGSSQLSHLFSQGVVSGELFVSDREFRRKLNEELPSEYKLSNVITRPDPSEYEVVYGIISKLNKSFDIPFFSKVSLRNARRRLEGYGYKVTIKKIQNVAAMASPKRK